MRVTSSSLLRGLFSIRRAPPRHPAWTKKNANPEWSNETAIKCNIAKDNNNSGWGAFTKMASWWRSNSNLTKGNNTHLWLACIYSLRDKKARRRDCRCEVGVRMDGKQHQHIGVVSKCVFKFFSLLNILWILLRRREAAAAVDVASLFVKRERK